MQFPFSFWKRGLIDPLSLGQPPLYIAAFPGHPGTLTHLTYNQIQNNTPISGPYSQFGRVATIDRYSDFGITWTRNTDSSPCVLMSENGLPYLEWQGTSTTNGLYTGGPNTLLPFMHQNGNCEFTVYWVFRNITADSTTTKIALSSANQTGERGFNIVIANSGSNRIPRLQIFNDTIGQQNVCDLTSYTNSSAQTRVYSWRGKQPASIGQDFIYGYINGVLVTTAQQSVALSNTANSFRGVSVGNRQLNSLRFGGGICELIIFEGMHDEATHEGVVKFLMERWGVS